MAKPAMAKPLTLRGWATPLLMGAVFLMAGTGVVMFFKFDDGVMAPIHRLVSWIFLVGAVGHIAANIRPFKNHLSSTLGRTSAIAFGTLLIVSFFSWGQLTTPKLFRSLQVTMANAPVSALAEALHVSADGIVRGLHSGGIVVTPHQTIHEAAAANHVSDDRLLSIVIALAKR